MLSVCSASAYLRPTEMSGHSDPEMIRVPLQLSRGCIIAPVQIDLTESVLTQFRTDILNFIQLSSTNKIIIDVSGVEVMDAHEFEALRLILDMTQIMGSEYIVVGLNPGIVSTLINVNARTDGLRTAVSLDEAHKMLTADDEYLDAELNETSELSEEAPTVENHLNEADSEDQGTK